MLDGGEGQVGVTLVATGTIEMLASAQHVTVASTHAMGCELLVSNVSTIIAIQEASSWTHVEIKPATTYSIFEWYIALPYHSKSLMAYT